MNIIQTCALKEVYSCKKSNKWIKITKENNKDIPFDTHVIKCSKCNSFAFLNFIHEELGDYYGSGIHEFCQGRYVYLCSKRRDHIVEIYE